MLFGTINNTPIRIPFGTRSDASTPLFGVFKAGNGFSVDNGILNVGIATSDDIGGIKTGYRSSGLNKAVELDPQTQKAYVNLSGISVNSTIKSWYKTTEFSSENLPKTYHVQTHDKWINYQVEGSFNTLFNNVNPTESNRIYPICQDTEGKMFTFVPWSDTTYGLFNDTRSGIVPYTSGVTNKSTKFLNAAGNWASVPYSSLTGTPNVLSSQSHASNTNYLVKGSGYSTTPTKYLKEDGTWSVPTDTTYKPADISNSIGLLSVSESYPNTVGCTVIEPVETPTTVIPIRCDDDNQIHVVVLDDIVEAIVKNEDFINAFAAALAIPISEVVKDNQHGEFDSWKNALGL
jgi:hypothetical protein